MSGTRKYGGPKRRVWRKIHLGIDEETLEVRAVEVTSSDIGDAPMLPELLAQIPIDQDIASMTPPPHGLQVRGILTVSRFFQQSPVQP